MNVLEADAETGLGSSIEFRCAAALIPVSEVHTAVPETGLGATEAGPAAFPHARPVPEVHDAVVHGGAPSCVAWSVVLGWKLNVLACEPWIAGGANESVATDALNLNASPLEPASIVVAS